MLQIFMDRYYCTWGLSLLFQRVKFWRFSPISGSPEHSMATSLLRLLRCRQNRQNEQFGNVENTALETIIIHYPFTNFCDIPILGFDSCPNTEPYRTLIHMSWRYLRNRWFSSNWYGKFLNLVESWHPRKNEEQTHSLPSHLFTPSILTPRWPMGRDAGAVRRVSRHQHDTT